MGTATFETTLTVAGFSASAPGVAGPALLAAEASTIVLTIANADGHPVTDLAPQDFATAALGLDGGTTSVRPFTFEGLSEPASGVYVIALPTAVCRANRVLACVVDVHDRRRGELAGRAVIPLLG